MDTIRQETTIKPMLTNAELTAAIEYAQQQTMAGGGTFGRDSEIAEIFKAHLKELLAVQLCRAKAMEAQTKEGGAKT